MSKKEKAEKVKKLSEADATKAILEFLRRGNRPYSAQMIVDQLRGAVSKAAAEKLLTALSEKAAITTKAFGKANLYWTKQDEMPEVDKDGFAKLETSVAEIKAEQQELIEECKELRAQISMLLSQPTNAKADELVMLTETQIEAAKKKLTLFQSGQKLVTPEQREKAQRRYNVSHREWRTRKRLFTELADALSIDKAQYEELGVETDEMVGMTVDDPAMPGAKAMRK